MAENLHGNTATAEPPREGEIIAPGHTFGTITDKISSIVTGTRAPMRWWIAMAFASSLVGVLIASLGALLLFGTGVWGLNAPIAWGFDIVNFVWWVGIGHAGTLISAVLFLLRQKWRTSINRFAEAMTLFAVASAGLYPLFHMGRPWFFYWLMPYPNVMALWPQWRSPLVWDVFAISTYAGTSLMFWFVGLIPDLATLRDRATSWLPRVVYGVLAMGWRGSAVHWHRYETAYALLAGLATPLVVSVHTVVSFDFAVSILPGWHTTIFPPYFVAGAIYSGFAMVLTLAIPIRKLFKLEDFITGTHLDFMAKIMLTTGLLVAYGYLMELFMAWYSGELWEQEMMKHRMFGPYGYHYWALILCNVITPQSLWFPKVRHTPSVLWCITIVVNLGMWLERYVILMTNARTELPDMWARYAGSIFDYGMYVGSIGLFCFLLLLFIRFLPMISIFEMRTLLPEAHVHHEAAGHTGGQK